MGIIEIIIFTYTVGCVLSFAIIKFMDYIANNVDKSFTPITKAAEKIGVLLSWLLVFYFLYSLFKMSGGNATIGTSHPLQYKTKDSDLIKATIDNYWVKAIKDPEFDTAGKVPLKHSLLCEKYHRASAYYIGDKCRKCPIFNSGFGCLSSEPFFRYQNSIGDKREELRKDLAVMIAKQFALIYEDKLKRNA